MPAKCFSTANKIALHQHAHFWELLLKIFVKFFKHEPAVVLSDIAHYVKRLGSG